MPQWRPLLTPRGLLKSLIAVTVAFLTTKLVQIFYTAKFILDFFCAIVTFLMLLILAHTEQ